MRSAAGDRSRSNRHSHLEPIAVVDIGSNSVRLVVYEGAVRAPTPLFNEKEQCGLGRRIASTGRLGRVSVEQAIRTLARFRAIINTLGVKNVIAFATAAVREALDGREFLDQAERALGLRIQLLSGAREAQLAALGIAMGFGQVDGVAGDLGGGSLELVELTGASRRNEVTLPLGGLRLIDVTGGRIDKATDLIDEHLARAPWVRPDPRRPFFAVGGTWRALAKLHMTQVAYPLRVLQGYAVPTRDAIKFCESLRKKKLNEVRGAKGVAASRRDTLPYGALVLERLLKRLEPSQLVFSVFGIREGMLYEMLPEAERIDDPLLSFCKDYARLRSRSIQHAHELCDWTDVLFSIKGLEEKGDERRLRHAACLLSDIGWRATPDYRGEHSLTAISHSAMTGVDHPGRLFLALAVFFRHAGPSESVVDELSSSLKALVKVIDDDARAVRRARVLAAAIRAAHMLSIGQSGIIPYTPLTVERGKLVLTIPPAHATLDGERLRRRFESLARLLDLELNVRLTG